jgi:hypothetical protein
MKLALCISGMPRHFKECYQSIKDNIIDLYDTDVFIDVWNDKISNDLNHVKKEQNVKIFDQNTNVIEIYNLYKPKNIRVEEYNENTHTKFVNLFPDLIQHGNVNYRYYSFYYKVFSCKNLKASHEVLFKEKYDICMRIRADCFILNKFIIPDQIDDNNVYMPFLANQNGVNDQIWYANTQTFNKICDLFPNLSNLKQFLGFPSETWLKIYLDAIAINPILQESQINNFILYKYINSIHKKDWPGNPYVLEKYKNENI